MKIYLISGFNDFSINEEGNQDFKKFPINNWRIFHGNSQKKENVERKTTTTILLFISFYLF